MPVPHNSRADIAQIYKYYDASGNAAAMFEATLDFAKKEIAPLNHTMYVQNKFPAPLWKKMGDQGLLGMTIKPEYGGNDAGYLAHLAVMEAISYYSGSVGLSYIAHSNLCMNQIQLNGTEEQKQKFLPKLSTGEFVGALAMSEPDAGSDVMAMGTRAVKTGSDYTLNGQKLWITNGGTADVVVTYAKTSPEKGAKGMTTFLVEKGMSGFNPGKKLDKLGMRGSETWELFFDNCVVPHGNIMGAVDGGAKVLMSGLNYERLMLIGGPLGLAQNSLDITINYMKERKQFNKRLADQQTLAHQVAQYHTELSVIRETAYAAAGRADRYGMLNNRDAAALFFKASDVAKDITLNAIRLCGGMGYTHDMNLGINHNDAILYEIGGGARDIRLEIVARSLFLA